MLNQTGLEPILAPTPAVPVVLSAAPVAPINVPIMEPDLSRLSVERKGSRLFSMKLRERPKGQKIADVHTGGKNHWGHKCLFGFCDSKTLVLLSSFSDLHFLKNSFVRSG